MGWEDDLQAKHGAPVAMLRGHVYVLHYDVPQIVMSVSADYAGPSPQAGKDGRWVSATPIRHYVGWTQQADPRKRSRAHGPTALREIVYFEPGTLEDEKVMKQTGICPKCGEPLAASLYRPAPGNG